MLLLVRARFGILVVDDEMDLVGMAALVGAEHDDVGGRVAELFLVKGLVVAQQLHVCATTLETVWGRTKVMSTARCLPITGACAYSEA